VSTTVSATFGVTSLSLGGYARWSNYAWIWLNWWLGDATGDLIVAPLLVLWIRPRVAPVNYKPIAVVWLALLMLLTGLVVFGGLLPSGMRNYPIEFLCIIPILWAAFRFGSLETTTTVALLVLIAIDGTLHGFGPFARLTNGESLMLLQAFIATTAAVTLPIAALVSALRRAESEARLSRVAAEEASRVKDQFLATLSYELRSPLGAIASAAHLLDYTTATKAETANAHSIILRQTEHLARIVDDLLDLARLSQGRIELLRAPVNLADCLSGMRQCTEYHTATKES
jgi:signal transduction histidine kinase